MYRKLRTWVVVSKSWRSVIVMILVVNLKEQFEKYLRVFYRYVYWSPTKHFGYPSFFDHKSAAEIKLPRLGASHGEIRESRVP